MDLQAVIKLFIKSAQISDGEFSIDITPVVADGFAGQIQIARNLFILFP